MDADLIRMLNLALNASAVLLLTVLLVRLVQDNARLRHQAERNHRLALEVLKHVREESSDEGEGT